MDIIEPQDSKPQGSESTPPDSAGSKSKKSPLRRLLEFVDSAGWEFWRTPAGEAYATVVADDVPPPNELRADQHKENWRLDSQQFADHLATLYYDRSQRNVLSPKDISRVMAVLRIKARRGQIYRVYRRCAFNTSTNRIYIDMGDGNWESIEVTPDKWCKVRDVPMKFVRSDQIRTLAEPTIGKYTIQQYMKLLVNLKDPDELILVIGFMMYALSGRGPYVVLCLYGGAGDGKSAMSEAIKRIIDPSEPETKGLPYKDEEQLMVMAENNHCLAFDNISSISVWQSDALCRLSTGAGIGVRQHYKHKDEVVYQACRPIILAGIEQFVQRNDLADRAVTVELAPFGSCNTAQRLSEPEYNKRVELLAGKVLGKLLDGLSCGLRRVGEIQISNLPRMGDFATFVTAAESAFGLEPSTFLKIYQQNISSNSSVAVESSSVVPLILEVLKIECSGAWQGMVTELWIRLNGRMENHYMRPGADWPKQPNMLSGLLKRLAPNLTSAGVLVDMKRTNRGSWVSLRLV